MRDAFFLVGEPQIGDAELNNKLLAWVTTLFSSLDAREERVLRGKLCVGCSDDMTTIRKLRTYLRNLPEAFDSHGVRHHPSFDIVGTWKRCGVLALARRQRLECVPRVSH